MKLSSISLVVAALAAIAGIAIAAPGPLHARALETIDSFGERDVDVNSHELRLTLLVEREVDSDDLFARATRGRGGFTHGIRADVGAATAAQAHRYAAEAWNEVVNKARTAHREDLLPFALDQVLHHFGEGEAHEKDVQTIRGPPGPTTEVRTRISRGWRVSAKNADESKEDAIKRIKELNGHLSLPEDHRNVQHMSHNLDRGIL